MSISPFIKSLNVSGGTLYSFSSSSNDLTSTFNNDATKFRFSKYVLLNIPDVRTPSQAENYIQFNNIDGAFGTTGSNNTTNLSESFQNFCLNLETTIISGDTYNQDNKLNVSERVFWKWLKELGGIRYRAATTSEKADGTGSLFVEEDDTVNNNSSSTKYSRVVKYIGNIDVINSVKNQTNAYSEIYINVPSKDGNTPFTLFNSIEDDNYGAAMTFTNHPENPVDAEVLYGRHINDTHPAGLSIQAFYDQDVTGGMAAVNSGTTVNGVTGNWYDPIGNIANSFYTDSTFNDATNDDIVKTNGTLTTSYKRNRLDGVTIDFNSIDYKPIVTNKDLKSINDWNASPDSGSFPFNAVLVYYDLFNSSNPEDSQTNLYGILFLDDLDNISGGGSRLKQFQKYKPNSVTKLNGNSYGFKINLKFDVSIDNVGVEKAINDYSSFSMDIFTDATITLQEATRALTDQNNEIVKLTQEIERLKDLILNDSDVNEINAKLLDLENQIISSKNIFADNQSLVELINRNYDEILNIYKNNTSLNIAYNLDVIKAGNGMFVNRNTSNQVSIETTQQEYNLSTNSIATLNPVIDNIITLVPFTNYFRHDNSSNDLNVTNNVIIKIDDSVNKWQNGQSFRLSIKDPINLDSYPLIIYTDAIDRLKTGTLYNKLVAIITSDDLTDGKGLFDIVCVNQITLDFIIDKIN